MAENKIPVRIADSQKKIKRKSKAKSVNNVTLTSSEDTSPSETNAGAKASTFNGTSTCAGENKYAASAEVDVTNQVNGRSEDCDSREIEELSEALKSKINAWSSARFNSTRGGESALPKNSSTDNSAHTGDNVQSMLDTTRNGTVVHTVKDNVVQGCINDRKNVRKHKKEKRMTRDNRQADQATDSYPTTSYTPRTDAVNPPDYSNQPFVPCGPPLTYNPPIIYPPPLTPFMQPVQYMMPNYDLYAMKLGHIQTLLETYFDDEHLFSHPYLRSRMDPMGYVHLYDCLSLPGMTNIAADLNDLANAVARSSVLELNGNCRVRRTIPPAMGWERLCLPAHSGQIPVLTNNNYVPHQNFAIYGQHPSPF